MFTGIITDIGQIRAVAPDGGNRHFTIHTHYDVTGIALGASIACDGVCLTVTKTAPKSFSVTASPETLGLTTLSRWQEGYRVNLERSLRMGDELGGHLVTGHVDVVGTLEAIIAHGGSWEMRVSAPQHLMPYIARKGSIAIDGISLTVNAVTKQDFTVMIIPHTWTHTTLQHKQAGDHVNLEIDPLARYIERQLQFMKQG